MNGPLCHTSVSGQPGDLNGLILPAHGEIGNYKQAAGSGSECAEYLKS